VYWQTPLDPLGWPLLAFGLALLAAFIGEMRRYERPGGVMERLALTVLGVAYCGLWAVSASPPSRRWRSW
jgi:hypothetical protein